MVSSHHDASLWCHLHMWVRKSITWSYQLDKFQVSSKYRHPLGRMCIQGAPNNPRHDCGIIRRMNFTYKEPEQWGLSCQRLLQTQALEPSNYVQHDILCLDFQVMKGSHCECNAYAVSWEYAHIYYWCRCLSHVYTSYQTEFLLETINLDVPNTVAPKELISDWCWLSAFHNTESNAYIAHLLGHHIIPEGVPILFVNQMRLLGIAWDVDS